MRRVSIGSPPTDQRMLLDWIKNALFEVQKASFENYPTPADTITVNDDTIGLGVSNVQEAIEALVALIAASVTTAEPGYLFGCALANGTDATNDIDVAAGMAASDEAFPIRMTHASGTMQLDVAYGTGNGGRFDTSISDGTWHCFVISNGATVARGMSKSLNPTGQANYPAGFTHYRRIGSIVRSAGAIRAFYQRGDRFMWRTSITDRSSTSATAIAALAMSIPIGVEVFPIFEQQQLQGTGGAVFTSFTDGIAGGGIARIVTGTSLAGEYAINIVDGAFMTNTSGQLFITVAISSGTLSSNSTLTQGFIDHRGQL